MTEKAFLRHPADVNAEMLKMIGVDPDTATEVVICITSGNWPEVRVTRIVFGLQPQDETREVISNYVLKPVDQE